MQNFIKKHIAKLFIIACIVAVLIALIVRIGNHQPHISAEETELATESATEEPTELPDPKLSESSQTVEHLGEFMLTAYCTCSKCCEQYADGLTSTNVEAVPGRTIAVDPRVIPMGSTVYINGTEYTAEDTGGAIKGNRIDVLFPSHQEALEFGIQYADVSYIRN